MDTATSPAFLRAITDQDFAQLIGSLEPDATMRALLPGGMREWTGAESIGAAFARWFGDTSSYEALDTSLDGVGDLIALSWRLRLSAARFDAPAMVVEQHVYAAIGPTGRIARLSLMCSGFWPEGDDAVSRG